MESPSNENKRGLNQVFVIKSRGKPKFANYRNRLAVFWALNNLLEAPLVFCEKNKVLTIGFSSPSVQIFNRISRIIKIISWRKGHSCKLIFANFGLKELLQGVDVK